MMDKTESYKTVRQAASAELVERRSRFIAHVSPVATEPDALAFLEKIRTQHRDATHNVYAYVLSDNHISRFSDDGEPGGTAGMPVLDVLRKEGLTDVIVVVTRYFGGVLLGAGGLVRAYGKAAHDGVHTAGVVSMRYCHGVTLDCPYELLGKVRYFIETGRYILEDISYAERVSIAAYVPHGRLEEFCTGITDATGGAVSAVQTGERYVPENDLP